MGIPRPGFAHVVCGVVLWLLGCGPTVARSEPSANVPEPAQVTLSIVSTNDVHGRLSQLPLFGGYVENLRALRKQTGGGLLLLDAGDIFQGTLESNATEGAAMVRAYQALGYDAVTLGNHEFDFGPVGSAPVPATASDDPLGALKARIAEASFPFLNANLRRDDGQALAVPKLRPSIVLRPAGVPVGIIGGVTEDVLRTTHAGNTRGIAVQRLGPVLAAEAQRLRAQGARVVIALVHAGGECKKLRDAEDLQSCEQNSEVFRLARELPRGSVDVIIAGHTHAGLAHKLNGIAIIEAFSNGRAFGRVDLTLDRHNAKLSTRAEVFAPTELCLDVLDKPSCAQAATYAERPVERSQRVLSAIEGDLKRARAERERLLGVNVTSTLWRESRSESPLNNLVADLMLRASSGADAAFTNAGAIRIPLPQGPLRYGTVFEMFPFDNTFATLNISAQQLAAIVVKNLAASNGILGLSGVRAAASCEGQQLRARLYTLAGELIDPQRRLRVVTSDFLASSGDGLLTGVQLDQDAITIERDKPIRDALLDGLLETPGATLSGDDKRLFDRENPRIRFAGARPVRCH